MSSLRLIKKLSDENRALNIYSKFLQKKIQIKEETVHGHSFVVQNCIYICISIYSIRSLESNHFLN